MCRRHVGSVRMLAHDLDVHDCPDLRSPPQRLSVMERARQVQGLAGRRVRRARPSESRAGTVVPLSVRTLTGGDVGIGRDVRPSYVQVGAGARMYGFTPRGGRALPSIRALDNMDTPLPFGTSRVPNPFLLFLPVFVEESPAKRIRSTLSVCFLPSVLITRGRLRESGMRENCTYRLSGGRRPAPAGRASSDPTPLKAANKGAQAPAESPEGRASTKGNSRDQSTHRTQGRDGVSQAVKRIRQAATRAVCRQPPKVGAVCVNAHVRI